MPPRKSLIVFVIILVCTALAVLVTSATYYITYQDLSHGIGGPTIFLHGWPLHWTTETWPMPRPYPGPVLPTYSYEPVNFLIDTVLYATLFIAAATIILHTRTKTPTLKQRPTTLSNETSGNPRRNVAKFYKLTF